MLTMTSDLPSGWMIRPPALDDVPEILAVVHASDIAAAGEPDFTTDGSGRDPRRAPTTTRKRDSWVALTETGRIVGWASNDNPSRGQRDTFDAYVRSRARPGGTPAPA